MTALLLQRFQTFKTIHSSPFKEIQIVVDRNSGETATAKIQQSYLLKNSNLRNVLHEASFLQPLQGYRGVPFMIWSGKTKQQKIVLITQELGDMLVDRFNWTKRKFSLKTVCMIGVELIQIIKTIHDKGYILSNISMDLFQFGKGEKALDLYINNFSQCIGYRDQKTMAHILEPTEYKRKPKNIFQSSAVINNIEKSRRDDVQSLVLVLIYLAKGKLPWQELFNKKPISQVNFQETFNNVEEICSGLPKFFADILIDCRGLAFKQQPPYHWYMLKMKNYLYREGEQFDYIYDWLETEPYLSKLRISANIPCLRTQKDNQFLNYIQERYVGVELEGLYIKQDSRVNYKKDKAYGQKVITEEEQKERQGEGKIKKKESTKKKNLIMENGTNKNIMERKRKNKSNCLIM